MSFVEFFDGKHVVSAKCLPGKALVTNKSLDFSIVAVPSSFATIAGIEPVEPKLNTAGVQQGETVVLQHNTLDADRGKTEDIPLIVTSVTENEILCLPQRATGDITLGCPVYNFRQELIAMVVRPRGGAGEDAGHLRAMRVDALLERLRKRSQTAEALGRGEADSDGDTGPPAPIDPSDSAVTRRRRRAAGVTPLRGLALAAIAAVAACVILWDVSRMRARALTR